MQESMWKKLLATIFSMMLAALLCATGFYTVRAEENISPAMVYDFRVITQKEEYSVDQAGNTGKQGAVPGTDGLNKAYLFNVTLPSVVGQGAMKFAFFTTDMGGFWSENGKILFVHNEYIALRGGVEEELAGEPNNNCWYAFSANGGALAPSATLKIEVGVQTVYENETHTANRYYVKYNDTEIISYIDTSMIVPGTGFHGPEIDPRDNGNVVKLSSTLTEGEVQTEYTMSDVGESGLAEYTQTGTTPIIGTLDAAPAGNVSYTHQLIIPEGFTLNGENSIKYGVFVTLTGAQIWDMPENTGIVVNICGDFMQIIGGADASIWADYEKDGAFVPGQTYEMKFTAVDLLRNGEKIGTIVRIYVNDEEVFEKQLGTEYTLGAMFTGPYLSGGASCAFADEGAQVLEIEYDEVTGVTFEGPRYVLPGGSAQIAVNVAPNYELTEVTVNGQAQTLENNAFTLTNITENVTISAEATEVVLTEGEVQTEYTMSDVGESGLAEYTQTGTTPIIGTLDAAPAGNVSYTHQLIIPEGFTLNGENSIKYGVFVTLTGAQIWDMPENTGIVVNICGDFMQIIGGADASIWADYEKDGAFVPGQTYEMKFTAVDLLRNGEKIGTIVRIYVNDEEVFEKQLGTEYTLGAMFTGPYLSGGASCAFADEGAQVLEIEYDEVTGVTFEGPKYVLSGGSAQIAVDLQSGYRLTALTANSADVMQSFKDGVLTLSQIAESTVVSGAAEYVTYKVGFEENENAIISVNKTEFEFGSDGTVIFTVTPDEGYSVTGLFIGETDYIASAQRNGNVWTLQLGGIEEDITLRAVCEKSVYTMSETSEHGTVTFSAQTVEHGGSVTVTVTADEGWEISSVLVNGQEQAVENGSFTIENVTSDINIEAVFAEVPQMGGCSGSAGMAGGAAGIAAVVLAAVCLILIKGRKKV